MREVVAAAYPVNPCNNTGCWCHQEPAKRIPDHIDDSAYFYLIKLFDEAKRVKKQSQELQSVLAEVRKYLAK